MFFILCDLKNPFNENFKGSWTSLDMKSGNVEAINKKETKTNKTLNPKKERMSPPAIGPKTLAKATTTFAAPTCFPLDFFLLNFEKSV